MLRRLFTSIVFSFVIIIASTQPACSDTVLLDLNTPVASVIPADKDLRRGTLPNGLSYYVRKNAYPSGQAFIHTIIRTGALDEKDHEQGIAHFLEHVVFKGSPLFANEKALSNFLKENGLQNGADSNAYTDFSHVNYFFVLPSNKEGVVKKGLAALADFTGKAFLNDESIDKERPIVLDEIQLRDSVGMRTAKALYKSFGRNSLYPVRFPAGLPEVIRSAPYEVIRNFYKKWYRPDNITVIAVGDFDVDEMENAIRELFGTFKNPESPLVITDHTPSPLPGDITFSFDPEEKENSLLVAFPFTEQSVVTVGDVRNDVIHQIIIRVLEERCRPIQYSQSSPLQKIYPSYDSRGFGNLSLMSIDASFKAGKIKEGLTDTLTLMKQFIDHGITESELIAARKRFAGELQHAIDNLPTLHSGAYTSIYKNHALKKDATFILPLAAETDLELQILATLTSQDINAMISKEMSLEKAIYFFAGQGSLKKELDTQDLSAHIKALQTVSTSPIENNADIHLPVITSAEVHHVVCVEEIPSIDATRITLSNGIVVFHKKTEYSENVISIEASTRGGFTSYDNDPTIDLVCQPINFMGYGGLKRFELSRILQNKPECFAVASIDMHTRSFYGSCRRDDIAFFFNLLFTVATQPNSDEEMLALFKNKIKEKIDEKQLSPLSLFSEKTTETVYEHPSFFKPLSHDVVDQMDLARTVSLYKKAFSNLSEFTFAISGNISLEELTKVLEESLCKIPQQEKQNFLTWEPLKVSFPAETAHVVFDKKSQGQTISKLFFPCSFSQDVLTRCLANLYNQILSERLHERLRFDETKSYGAAARLSGINDLFSDAIDTSGRCAVHFSSSKENVKDLIDVIRQEMRAIQANGFTEEELEHARKIIYFAIDKNFQTNGAWNSLILETIMRGLPTIESINDKKERYTRVTLDELNAFAKNLVNPDHYWAHTIEAGNSVPSPAPVPEIVA